MGPACHCNMHRMCLTCVGHVSYSCLASFLISSSERRLPEKCICFPNGLMVIRCETASHK